MGLRLGRRLDRPVGAERLAELGLLPRECQNTARAMPDPGLERVVTAAHSGDWRPGAEYLVATGARWDRRTAVIEGLAGAARRDDVWLRHWRSDRPDDPGAPAVQAKAMIDLAWQIRDGERPARTERERSEGFFRLLSRAGQEIARAKELGERDPTPYVADIWRGIGMGRPPEEMRRVWSRTVDRDPHHLPAHRAALAYWSGQCSGSRKLALGFAEDAAASAPPGRLISSLWLTAWLTHREGPGDGKAYGAREVMEAVDRLHEDVTAADADHPYLAEIRHVLAYFCVRQGRGALALEQFRLVDGYVGAFPWSEAADPAETYCAFRDLAVNMTRR
ncbi:MULTISPECIES: hypothetical protein [Streptomyces]|uniref:DUF4034 domain-containing protein n=2 Tax=Streptomyces TaxID=1883 RepID=A0A646KAU4_STRJU|nr:MULTISPECIES: hypothetical protein [Streptomyces]MQS34549.1 hypothetical protein [Streptomyces katsurahamanus]MQS99229.1 hypothetical protein [Streptomyces jumonjinensis]